MQALGRLLQIIGWLWLVAGFILPALGVANINVFPGIILVFVARALRTQASRNAPEESADMEPAPEPERILNTERVRVEPEPSPKPPPPSPQPVSIPRQTEQPSSKQSGPSPRDSLIERIAGAGREVEADLIEPDPNPDALDVTAPGGVDPTKPMSSEEMIAAAHRRWNTDKRQGRS